MPVPCVYILASRRNGTLYVGVTSDLTRRVWEHKQDLVAGFTKRYQVHTLVWFEVHGSMAVALQREKAIKEWRRAWKLDLIEADNPEWRDLYEDQIR
jgi:putative endonuclease